MYLIQLFVVVQSKKMVPRTRIELVIIAYQATVIPFNYPGKVAVSEGFEPSGPSSGPMV